MESMTAPTGNTAPLDHVLPDDPSTWTALDHAVAIANLRGAIIAREREEAQELRERVARLRLEVEYLFRKASWGTISYPASSEAIMAESPYLEPGDLDGAGEGGNA